MYWDAQVAVVDKVGEGTLLRSLVQVYVDLVALANLQRLVHPHSKMLQRGLARGWRIQLCLYAVQLWQDLFALEMRSLTGLTCFHSSYLFLFKCFYQIQ